MDNNAKINAARVLLTLSEKLLTEVAASRGDEKMKQGILNICVLEIYLGEIQGETRARK